MLDKVIENNRVSIIGEVVSEFEFSHEVFGEGFYLVNVSVNRLSDMVDIIPLMISERLVDVTKDYRGRKIEVSGQFRSYNRHEGVKNKLILSIFVREMQFIEEEEIPEEQARTNQIFLDGYVCKPPVYRKTPLGREIADILVAVNRPYGKSDYIPCMHGAEMQDMPLQSKSVDTFRYGAGYRAVNTRRKSARSRLKSVWHMKFPSAKLMWLRKKKPETE